MNLKSNKGAILIASYLIILVLLILIAALCSRSLGEMRIADIQTKSTQALHIAEGGLERALYDLKQDFMNDTNPSYADGEINGIVCGPDSNNFYTLPYASTLLGNGYYKVELKNIVGKDEEIWVRSTGTLGNISRVIQTYIKVENVFPWNNAIFAGTGSNGTTIEGNVDIRGSVHILGTNLLSSDLAINMSGGAYIGNNYEGMPLQLKNKISLCPTATFNGEIVEVLRANLRIKHGLVGLSGGVTVGKPDVFGNFYKETMDGVYVTDGFGGDKGEANVYSDNGTQNSYDLGDDVKFANINDPYKGYITYQEYLKNNALVISNPTELNEIATITPGSTFNYIDPGGKGSISMDGSGNLTISGIVYINGGNLNMDKKGPNKTILYSGKGLIFITGNVRINVNLLTQGNNSFPTNILGIITSNEISFSTANIDVMGLFYAENKITIQKQTNVVGAIMANYFDMGLDVPNIYQVPEIVNSLPPDMIAGDPIWVVKIIGWQKL